MPAAPPSSCPPLPFAEVWQSVNIAAVEVLRRPELTGLPVVVGGRGDPRERAVVSTASYGVFLLARRNWSEVMGARPTTALWGVGARIGSRLATHGYDTVDQLAAADDEVLAGEFGPRMGPHYRRLGRGEGPDVVDDAPWVPRAHGRETTYQHDLTDPAEVEAALRTLADDRPIRLLGIRAEMVPPEGGYERPRTTGRGGPAAADPSAEE